MKMVKEKISDALFCVFYVILFPLQTLPSWAIAFVEFNNIWFWPMCGVGFAAMIAQAIKFPCFNTRIWNSAMVALFIVSFFMKGWAI